MSACALRSLAVKRLPNTRVKGGDFRWWRSVGAGKQVDSRRGDAFPARRPVGTDIRLETGDDAARENGASAPRRRGGRGKRMLRESVHGRVGTGTAGKRA